MNLEFSAFPALNYLKLHSFKFCNSPVVQQVGTDIWRDQKNVSVVATKKNVSCIEVGYAEVYCILEYTKHTWRACWRRVNLIYERLSFMNETLLESHCNFIDKS